MHRSFLSQLFACIGLCALRAARVVSQQPDQQNCCALVNTQGHTYKQASSI